MGRMHAPGKGISASALPYRRTVPSWQKSTATEIREVILKLAKKGTFLTYHKNYLGSQRSQNQSIRANISPEFA